MITLIRSYPDYHFSVIKMCSWPVIRIGSRIIMSSTVYTHHTEFKLWKKIIRGYVISYRRTWFSIKYSILKFRSKHKILTLGFFGIFRCIRTVCNQSSLHQHAVEFSLNFFFFLFCWPKLFKIVSIIVLCKRAWWPRFLSFVWIWEKLYFSDRNAN